MNALVTNNGTMSRILVVEDEALIAEEIQDRLTRLNFEVVGIEDTGQRAIDAVLATQPDLVLMDIHLKGAMDGIAAAEAIRLKIDVPVIFLTAHSDHATLQRAKRTAPLGYVLKPFHERELMITIEMALYRHGLERRLRESECRYAATLASIGDGVLATDQDGRVTFMNPVAEQLTGWSSDEAHHVPAERVFVLVAESTRRSVPHPIAEALHLGVTIRLTEPVLLVPREGAALPIDDSAAPIKDAQGNILGAVVAFRDIRPKRKSEDALQRIEAQLRQAQKMEAVGRLAGGVAHDFNNFLTVINGCSEHLLQRGSLSERDAELVNAILKASERSAGLTRQLLAFGRRQLLKPCVLDLNDLVGDTEQLLCRLISENVRVCVSLGASKAAVRADPGQLEQVIMNLAVNARDAMPGGGTLSIATADEDVVEPEAEGATIMPAGDYVVLSVHDTGMGMDDATRAQIFEPFFTTKALGKGTGLGLATVYGIVHQSGGFIFVDSELGQGTTFRIYLPKIDVQNLPTRAAQAVHGVAHGVETVLLIEDDDAVRSIASSGLQSFGYRVLEAQDGNAALKIFEQHRGTIDVLVTDTMMPGMSGPQIAERLLAARSDLPVLFLSGYANDASNRRGIMATAAFLPKPFTPFVLAQKVREVLDEHARRLRD